MEDSWELVAVPAEIQHSTIGKEASLDASEASLEKNEENNKSKVCNFPRNSWQSFKRRALQPENCLSAGQNVPAVKDYARDKLFKRFIDREILWMVINYVVNYYVALKKTPLKRASLRDSTQLLYKRIRTQLFIKHHHKEVASEQSKMHYFTATKL